MKSEVKLFSSGILEEYYEVGEVLGKGGFGIVYAGIRKKDKMKVAIKHIAQGKVTGLEMINILKDIFSNNYFSSTIKKKRTHI